MIRFSMLSVLAAAAALVGCSKVYGVRARQYVLELDAANASNHQICHRDSGQRVDATPTCTAFAGEPLDAPGTMTVLVKNRKLDRTYDLRVSSFTTEANPAAASALLDRVLGNLQELATLGVQRATDKTSGAAKRVVEQITANALGSSALADKAKSALIEDDPAATTHQPEPIFRSYITANKKLGKPADIAADDERTITNAPTVGSPPARAVEYTAADLAYLTTQGVSIAELAAHTTAWCAPSSFDTAEVKWQERLKTELDAKALTQALGLTAEAVATAILTRSSDLLTNIDKLTDEAWADFGKASPAARTLFLMHWSASIQKDLARCVANLAFVEGKISDAATRADIAKTRQLIAPFLASLAGATNLYAQLAPIFEEAVRRIDRVLALTGDTFSSFSLDPGTLDLGLGEKAGEERHEIASYKLDVRGVDKLAITVGPAILWCKSCFEQLDIKTSPAGDGGAATRQLARTRTSREYAVVAALHNTVYATRSIGLGLLLGYPVTQPADTAKSALIGLGLRRRALQLGFGAHFFSVRRTLPEYEAALPIDLSMPGNEALSSDDISSEHLAWSWFLYFGYSRNI